MRNGFREEVEANKFWERRWDEGDVVQGVSNMKELGLLIGDEKGGIAPTVQLAEILDDIIREKYDKVVLNDCPFCWLNGNVELSKVYEITNEILERKQANTPSNRKAIFMILQHQNKKHEREELKK